MKKLLCLIALVALLGCGKSNPVAMTPPPDPEVSTLSVWIDHAEQYPSGYIKLYFNVKWENNKSKTFTITSVMRTRPDSSTYYFTVYPTTIVPGQTANYVYDKGDGWIVGTWTITVNGSWDGGTTSKSGSKNIH